jgi:hypothetical protein
MSRLATSLFDLSRLRRAVVAVCIAAAALVGSGVEQLQLSQNVMAATVAEAGAPSMQAPCPDHVAAHAGGHTHKGHADCAICGTLAFLAAFTLPLAATPVPPAPVYDSPAPARGAVRPVAVSALPYRSRAPPIFA